MTESDFLVVSADAARGYPTNTGEKFVFRVPPHWRSPIPKNPLAIQARRHVLQWLETLGCTPEELTRARRFDIEGYVGFPFPTLPLDKTIRVAKHLTLWLLWDDVEVESRDNRWRIDPSDILKAEPPKDMSRFDLGWWQLLKEFSGGRSELWLRAVCQCMETWSTAARQEALAVRNAQENKVFPSFTRQMDLRIATIGMYATVYLLEDVYDFELPRSFHLHPTVMRLKTLSNKIVGIGNDLLSFGKDFTEGHLNLTSTLMHERAMSVEDAFEYLILTHNTTLLEFDRLAGSLGSWSERDDPFIARWLQDVRYASLGFSLWEAQSPRYTAYKVVVNNRVIEPRFTDRT